MNLVKRVSSRTLLVSVVISILALIVISVGAMAFVGYSRVLQHTANGVEAPVVEQPNYTFDILNSDGTTPATEVLWGDVTIGTPSTKNLYIYNTGNRTFDVTLDNSSVPAGWSLSMSECTALAPTDKRLVTLTINAGVAGPASFSTLFQSIY